MNVSAKAKTRRIAIAWTLLLFAALAPAHAANKFLLQGIQDYRNGDFNAAAGNLGAAMSTDFNNAMLHYYMGNCCVHLKQMESAVREFRIAYALDPTGQVGKFAKQALDYLDVDAQGQGLTKKAAPSSYVPKMDPAMERALAALDKQAQTNSPYGKPKAASQMPWWMQQKHGNDVPPELSRYLDGLRQQYEGNYGGYYRNSRPPSEVQKSAENLKKLLQETPKDGKHHLSPHGTNLYTRNYTHSQSEPKPESAKPSVTPAPTPKAVPLATPAALPETKTESK
jgi:tetratricopeptide (TPR) repeat protein